jgi:hypothetical protein
MSDKLKTYGVESYYKSPRIYINDSWVPFETETLIINDEIVAVSYLDKATMPPSQREYGDKNSYINPKDLDTGQHVHVAISTPGENDNKMDAKAEYIGIKQGAKDCTVHASKDFFMLGVLTAYFRILEN